MSKLTNEEIQAFKRQGFLIKRGILDPELMARAREAKWAGAPPRLKKEDPTTWLGPWLPEEETSDAEQNCRTGFTWKYRVPASEKWLVGMMATNPVIFGWAEQLLGKGEVVTPDKRDGPSGTRGIYCRLPAGHLPEEPTICHCDVGPDHLHSTANKTLFAPGLGVVGLIEDIPPHGGAFTVWPGTHQTIYNLFLSIEGLERNEAYKKRIIEFNEDHHVEGFGKAGDVLLWHRLLAHAAGHNRSKKLQLREAVLCDYKKYEELDSPDLVSYRDMWCQWSEEVSLTAS